MKKYDAYKPSGVEWIGEIPAQWDVKRGKYIVRLLSGFPADSDLFTDDDSYMPLIRIRDIDNTTTETFYKGEYPIEYLIKNKDILVGMDGEFNIAKWKGSDAILNQRVCKIIGTNEMHSLYAFYLFQTPLKLINDVTYSTTVKHLSTNDIKDYRFPTPPLLEQKAIADYLDAKCAKIDNVVAVQRKRIELLKELKQSIITRAVTKGLDKNAKMKDSGIDWIGEVPSNWSIARLKFLFSRSIAGVWGDEEKGNNDDIVCFRVADFDYERGCLNLDDNTIRNIDRKTLKGRIVKRNDLLIEKSGGGDTSPVGRVVKVNTDIIATCSNFIHIVTVADGNESTFIYYYFKFLYSNKINLLFFNQTTGIQNLKIPSYLGQMLYLPPLAEQNSIADYLDRKCAVIDRQIAKVEKQIELLNEYKLSVITECVTGKRKVC